MVKRKLVIQLLFIFTISLITGDNVIERQPRGPCMKEVKDTNCNEPFVEKYPELSRSFSNLTLADSFFYLFTSKSPEKAEFLHMCGGGLSPNSNFRPDKPTVIIAHGFTQSPCYQAWPRDLKNEYMKRDYNVILLDWTWGNAFNLADSVQNMRIAAVQLAVLIDNIKTQRGVTEDNFQLIGMSLGVQLTGLTGRRTKVRRITALDQAGFFYTYLEKDDMLKKEDAKLVDVIHTGGGDCLPFFGDKSQAGISDFYVNGGSVQSNCFLTAYEYLLRGDVQTGVEFFIPFVCWHLTSIRYFATTINPNGCEFWATKCNSYEEYKKGKCGKCDKDGPDCEIMGQNWEATHDNSTTEGARYYLDIKPPCPYCGSEGNLLPIQKANK